jgi:hypothetical protein
MANFDQREDSDTTVAPVRRAQLVVETPISPAALRASSGRTFAPISTFPPPAPPTVATRRRKTPAWVVAYLALCAVLTIVGLVALLLEERMLGHALH